VVWVITFLIMYATGMNVPVPPTSPILNNVYVLGVNLDAADAPHLNSAGSASLATSYTEDGATKNVLETSWGQPCVFCISITSKDTSARSVSLSILPTA
jgi:hypothetical protein